jgi:hypothetical protein
MEKRASGPLPWRPDALNSQGFVLPAEPNDVQVGNFCGAFYSKRNDQLVIVERGNGVVMATHRPARPAAEKSRKKPCDYFLISLIDERVVMATTLRRVH